MSLVPVCILPSWGHDYYCRLSPGGCGIWDGIALTKNSEEADYIVILNQPEAPITISAAPERIWALIQEPPTPYHRFTRDSQGLGGSTPVTLASLRAVRATFQVSRCSDGR